MVFNIYFWTAIENILATMFNVLIFNQSKH